MKVYTKEMIEKINARKLKVRNAFKIIFTPIVILMVIICLYVAYQKLYLRTENVELLGYKSYIVLTGSMKPMINPSDMVICKAPTSEAEIKEGDIITFYEGTGGSTVTHRVESIIDRNGKRYFQTKGDNNNSADNELVEYKNIQGVYCFKISKIGWIVTKLLTGTGFSIVIFILVLCYHNSSIKEDRRLTREEARKKYNICKYKKDGEATNDTL